MIEKTEEDQINKSDLNEMTKGRYKSEKQIRKSYQTV